MGGREASTPEVHGTKVDVIFRDALSFWGSGRVTPSGAQRLPAPDPLLSNRYQPCSTQFSAFLLNITLQMEPWDLCPLAALSLFRAS